MNHPASETWVAYVYDELNPTERADAEAHLRVCPTCKRSVERLRETLAMLDQDKASLVLPPRRAARSPWMPAMRWALAASVILVAGFLAGQATGPSQTDLQREVAAVRQEFQAQLQDGLKSVAATTLTATAEENRRLFVDLARDLQAGRRADRQDLLTALDTLDQRRALDTAALRAGLVTLARRTGNGFQQTDSQLNLLASYLPPEPSPDSSTTPLSPEKKP
jgi:Putative zinc-finger